MNKDVIQEEMKFLFQLRTLSTQFLLDANLNSNNLPTDFDVVKGIQVLKRAMDAEIEYLQENPEEYLDIYG